MKQHLRRFVDWMEAGTTSIIAKIICFPALIALWLIAIVINSLNKLKGYPLMKSFESFKKRFSFFNKRVKARNGKNAKNPDWSRIEEPETFLQPFVLLMFTIFITVFFGMVNYIFAETGSLETSIARFLVPFVKAGQTFDQVYAVFTFAVLTLVEVIAYTFIAIMGEPDHHGIVGMITDLDVNTQDRIAELERTIDERMRVIETDIMPTSSPDEPTIVQTSSVL